MTWKTRPASHIEYCELQKQGRRRRALEYLKLREQLGTNEAVAAHVGRAESTVRNLINTLRHD